MKKKEQSFLIGMLFFTMLIMSISFSFRGIFIPTFKSDFNISDKIIGIFLSIIQLTSMISYILGNKFNIRFGQKKLMQMGLLINGLSFIFISFSKSFIHLTIGYVLITFATSIILLSINTTVPLLNVAFQSTLLNIIHGFFGIGNTFSQKAVGILIDHNITWRLIYRSISIGFFIAFLLYFLVYDFKKYDKEKHVDKKIKHKKELILFTFAIGFYVSAEIQTGNWFMNLLKNEYSLTALNATTYTTVFFATFTVGRLLGGMVTEKIGYFKSIIISSILSITVYLIGILLKSNGLFLIASSGLFFAIIFPTSMALVGKIFKDNVSKAIAFISTSITMFVLFTGLIMGYLNDLIGAYLAFYTIPICSIISLMFYLKLNHQYKNYS